MTSGIPSSLLALALVPAALAACAGSPHADTAAPQPDGDALATAIEAFDAGWNEHDAATLTGLMADDAVTLTPRGVRVAGPTEHRSMYESDGPTKQTQSKTSIQGVQWLADDLVLLDLQQTLQGPGVEQLGSDSARAVTVLRWDGTTWKIVAARPFVAGAR